MKSHYTHWVSAPLPPVRGKQSVVTTQDLRCHQEHVNTLISITTPITLTSNAINAMLETPRALPEAEDLSFLNKFTNNQIESGHDVDITMNSDIHPKDFVV